MGNRFRRRVAANVKRRDVTGKDRESTHVQLLRSQFQETFKKVTDYFAGWHGQMAQQLGELGVQFESALEILDSHHPDWKIQEEVKALTKEKKDKWEADQAAQREAADKARAEAAEAMKVQQDAAPPTDVAPQETPTDGQAPDQTATETPTNAVEQSPSE